MGLKVYSRSCLKTWPNSQVHNLPAEYRLRLQSEALSEMHIYHAAQKGRLHSNDQDYDGPGLT